MQHACVTIPKTKDQGVQEAKTYKGAAVYIDSSAQNGLVEIGAHPHNLQGWGPMSHTIADNLKLTNDTDELAAIEAVMAKIWFLVENKLLHNLRITIFTDSLYALTMLCHFPKKSGQFLVGSILRLNHLVCTTSQIIQVNFQWSHAHSKVWGNKRAHGLAQLATREGQQIEPRLRSFPLTIPILLRFIDQLDKKEILALTLGAKTKVGAFTQLIDKAVPRHHTLGLYNGKSKA